MFIRGSVSEPMLHCNLISPKSVWLSEHDITLRTLSQPVPPLHCLPLKSELQNEHTGLCFSVRLQDVLTAVAHAK